MNGSRWLGDTFDGIDVGDWVKITRADTVTAFVEMIETDQFSKTNEVHGGLVWVDVFDRSEGHEFLLFCRLLISQD